MNGSPSHTCRHCGISFRWKAIEHVSESDGTRHFCCRGCLGAYLLICGCGLDAFYQRPDCSAPTVPEENSRRFTDAELAGYVMPDGGQCRLDILIGGISCASCVWLLERIIGRQAGVDSVSLAYSAGIASVRFDPVVTAPSEIFAMISRLGYQPRPYSPTHSESAARRERTDLLLRFGTGLFLTMQLMAYSIALYAGYFQGMSPAMKDILQLFSFAVATPVVFYCGWPFLRGAWQGLSAGLPGMDLLIGVGAVSAWLYSSYAALVGCETYFESAAMIVTFVLIGRLLELSVRRRAMSGVAALYSAMPQHALLLEGAAPRQVAVEQVRTGDKLLVRQGERFPVDSRIGQGETEVDQSLVTGESMPVTAGPGDEIKAGSINVALAVTVTALRPVGQSYVMRVAALVQMAQAGKPSIQRLVDRVAGRFVPAVLLLALVVGFWLHYSGEALSVSLLTALSVVLIACPCALGLAVPTAVLAACSSSAARGVILRGGDVIERLATIDDLLLDKTGTVTCGRPTVLRWGTLNGFDRRLILEAAASLEQGASHPLARAIERLAAEQGLLPQECRDLRTVPGRGLSGRLVDGSALHCGSPRFLKDEGVDLSALPDLSDPAGTAVLVAVDGRLGGYFLLHDPVRAGAGELSAWFSSQRIPVWLVSGDTEALVARTAQSLGMSRSCAEMTPDRKLALVQDLQNSGKRVLMAGDGVNDAPALAQADLSCSIAGSSDLALENADLIITGADLSPLAAAHRIARSTMAIIRQNLVWAFLYNIIGIPLAVSGLLTPVYAAAAMTASSLMVSLNSLRLMRKSHHG